MDSIMASCVIGVRAKIGVLELRTHLLNRANYHELRAKQKEQELPKLKELLDVIKTNNTNQPNKANAGYSLQNQNTAGYSLQDQNTIQALEHDIKSHKEKVARFRFLADHLFAADYALEEHTLKQYEFIPSE